MSHLKDYAALIQDAGERGYTTPYVQSGYIQDYFLTRSQGRPTLNILHMLLPQYKKSAVILVPEAHSALWGIKYYMIDLYNAEEKRAIFINSDVDHVRDAWLEEMHGIVSIYISNERIISALNKVTEREGKDIEI